MLTRSKAETWIKHDSRLISFCFAPAPARFDKERAANFQRLEVAPPGFGPVLGSYAPAQDATGPNIEPPAFYGPQSG